MTISGRTKLIAHLGYPTESFKAPMIYNPYFEKYGIDAVVVPMGCKAEDYPAFLKLVFKLSNIRGALVTMPHKVTTIAAARRGHDHGEGRGRVQRDPRLARAARLVGDMFDGEGFVRGVQRKGRVFAGARVLVVGSGGVGSAIAASLAKAGVAELGLFDAYPASGEGLGGAPAQHYPALKIEVGSKDPAGFDIVVNATPLGMKDGDPLPMDVDRIAPVNLRRRSRDEAGDHAIPAQRQGRAAARSRSAPTCCSSRSRPISSSSAFARPRRTNCGLSRRSTTRKGALGEFNAALETKSIRQPAMRS